MSDQENPTEEFAEWDDDRLWQAYVDGEDDALYELVGRHSEGLFRYLLLATGRVRKAAQMTGEAWALVAAWRGSRQGFGSFREWLYAVATQNFVPPTQPETAGLGDVIDEFTGREAGAGLGAAVYRVVALLRHLRVPVLLRVAQFGDEQIGRVCNFTVEKAHRCVRKGCARLASTPEFSVDEPEDDDRACERIVNTLRNLDLPPADAAVLEYVHRCVGEALKVQRKMPHPPADPEPERTAAWKAAVIMGALVAVLLVLLGGLAYLARHYEPPPRVARAVDAGGTVEIKPLNSQRFHTYHEGQPLYGGTSLRTEHEARMAIEADTATVHVDETTHVALGPPGAYHLVVGRLHVEHTASEGPPVDVVTAPARVYVSGGRTVLRSDAERITAFCLSGTTTLSRRDQEDVVLRPGEAGTAGREGVSRRVRPFLPAFQTHWLRRFATMPGGPRSYDELMFQEAAFVWPPETAEEQMSEEGDTLAEVQEHRIESMDVDVSFNGPLARVVVTTGTIPQLGASQLVPFARKSWSFWRGGRRIRLLVPLKRQGDGFRFGFCPYVSTGQPIGRLSFRLRGAQPRFEGEDWTGEGDTWTAQEVDPYRGIIVELPAEDVARSGRISRPTAHGRLIDYEEDQHWPHEHLILVFDRAAFAQPRHYTRAYLFADRFLRYVGHGPYSILIDALREPRPPAPNSPPRIDKMMAQIWQDRPEEERGTFEELLQMAFAAAAGLEETLVVAVTGPEFELSPQVRRMARNTHVIVCSVPPGNAPEYAVLDGRPAESFWNARRVFWVLPPALTADLGVRRLLADMQSPGIPRRALPGGHRVMQAGFAHQPLVTVPTGE
jgi:hypothetical protein